MLGPLSRSCSEVLRWVARHLRWAKTRVLIGSGQDVCFGPSRPDPGRNARDEDGTRTGGDGPHLGTWMGLKRCKTKHMANLDGTTSETQRPSFPDPPILAFFDFLAFLGFPISLAFLCVCPLFSKDFRGSAKSKTLAFFGVSLAFFSKKARLQGLEGQGSQNRYIATPPGLLQGSLGPFGPEVSPGVSPRASSRVSPECPGHLFDTPGTLSRHFLGTPEGPGDTPWHTLLDTPDTLGDTPGDTRARETPVAGRGVRNHYTQESAIFKLFGDYSCNFQGSSKLIGITVTVSLFFYHQNADTGNNSPQKYSTIFCSYIHMI